MYSVTTQTSLPTYSSPHLEVKRRFRDFVALAAALQVRGTPVICRALIELVNNTVIIIIIKGIHTGPGQWIRHN